MINYSLSLAARFLQPFVSDLFVLMLRVETRLPADEFAKSLKRPDELLAGVWGTKRSGNYFNRRSLKAISLKSRAKGQTCLLLAVRVVDGAENKQNHFLPKRIPRKVLGKLAQFSAR